MNLSFIAIIISGLSLLLSLVVFINDLKIKKQQKKINEYQLEEIRLKKISEIKACLSIKIISKDSNSFFFEIANTGKVDANNLVIKDLDTESFLLNDIKSIFPVKVLANEKKHYIIEKYSDMPSQACLFLEWEDDCGKHSKEQLVDLLN